MATSHTPGSLVDALGVFRKYEVNLLKLESRPIIGNPWEEMFYLDFEGNITEEPIQKILDELGHHTRFMKVLGSYPSQELEKTKLEYSKILDVEEKTPAFEEKKEVAAPAIIKGKANKTE